MVQSQILHRKKKNGEKNLFSLSRQLLLTVLCVYSYPLATSDPCQATHPHLQTCYLSWGFSAIFALRSCLRDGQLFHQAPRKCCLCCPAFCRLAGPWRESLLPLPSVLPQEGGASRYELPPGLPFCPFWGLTQVFRLWLQVLLPTKPSCRFFTAPFLLETVLCCLR